MTRKTAGTTDAGQPDEAIEIAVPYGNTQMTAVIPAKRLTGIFKSHLPPAAADQIAEVSAAMDEPTAGPRLEELARGKRSAMIIASDHTRPVPSKIIMPEILRRLRAQNPDIRITILVATGFHRATTFEELENKFGVEIPRREHIVVHDSSNDAELVRIGTLPSGGELIVNRLAAETDLLVAEGFIEPHFFAGFSGGRKSVLPGVAARRTVLANHCAEFIQSPFSRTGVLENNPIHRDMLYAAQCAKLAFIVNVVINGDKKIVRAFAGDFRKAHEAGCDFLRRYCTVQVPESDIVITGNGGSPLDQNVYQAVKGMTAAESVCRRGGVIVMTAACNDGHGGESFLRNLSSGETPNELLKRIARVPRDRTEPDQWEFQIMARILSTHTVIMVTRDCPHSMLNSMGMLTASTLDEGVAAARKIAGDSATIAVIPDGVAVIAEKICR